MGDWPLVGRQREIAQLRSVLRRGRGLVIAGETGVGKTRLALEALEMAAGLGRVVGHAQATHTTQGLPFGALASFLPLDEHLGAAQSDRLESVLQRVATHLRDLGGSRGLVLLVDDAHLLDDASAALVHRLALANEAFVLITIRAREAAPDAIVALWKDDVLPRVEIDSLDLDTMVELLEQVLGGPVDVAAATQLYELSEGRPFFLYELVRGGLDAGSLRDDGGVWRIRGHVAPSNRLIEIVRSRIALLSAPERELLEIVSYGEPLGPGEIENLGYGELVEPLERKDLLTSRMNGSRLEVRLAHPAHAEALRQQVPAIRARDIARHLAEATEATSTGSREDNLRIATWRLDAGGGDPASLLAAARTCRWRYDFALAGRLVDAAIHAGAGFDARLLAAQLAGLQGRGDDEHAMLIHLVRDATTDQERGLATTNLLDTHLFNVGDVAGSLAIAEEAEASISDAEWRDEIAARRVAITVTTQGFNDAVNLVEPLLERTKDMAFVLLSLMAEYSLLRSGCFEESIERSLKGHQEQLMLAEPVNWEPCLHVRFQCEALSHLGRFEEARAAAAALYNEGIRSRSPDTQAFAAWVLSRQVVDKGHAVTAMRYANEAVAIFRQLARPNLAGFCLIDLATAAALAGRQREAVAAIAELDELGVEDSAAVGIDARQARAWVLACGGDLHQARQVLMDAAKTGLDIGDLLGAGCSLHALARLGGADDAVERLDALALQVDGQLMAARAAHTRAMVARDPGRLVEVAGTFAGLGAVLLAAEAATEAAGEGRRTGARKEWFAAERLAGELLESSEVKSSPSLRVLTHSALLLTPRELEVAMLAACGRTNKQVADELMISVRTVENQLHRVFEKLGITRRSDLASAIAGEE